MSRGYRTRMNLPQRKLAAGIDNGRRLALRMVGATTREAETHQGKLAFLEVKGSGTLPPVLLIHGLSGACVDWEQVIRRLKRHCQWVRAIDLPGHGRSETPRDGMGQVAFLEMLMEATGAFLDVPHHVVGSSLGGLMSVRLGARLPDRACSLSLISPGGAMVTQEELDAVLSLFEVREYPRALAFVDVCMGANPSMRSLVARVVQGRVARPSVQAVIKEFTPAWLLQPEELASLPMPILLYWGLQDGILEMDHLAYWRAHLPDRATVHTPETEGHLPWMDGPLNDGSKRFVGHLLDFWTRQ